MRAWCEHSKSAWALCGAGLALAMARDGSSGGVIRLCTISEAGQERQFFSGEDIPKFWGKQKFFYSVPIAHFVVLSTHFAPPPDSCELPAGSVWPVKVEHWLRVGHCCRGLKTNKASVAWLFNCWCRDWIDQVVGPVHKRYHDDDDKDTSFLLCRSFLAINLTNFNNFPFHIFRVIIIFSSSLINQENRTRQEKTNSRKQMRSGGWLVIAASYGRASDNISTSVIICE